VLNHRFQGFAQVGLGSLIRENPNNLWFVLNHRFIGFTQIGLG
jgi:hypothetical protein